MDNGYGFFFVGFKEGWIIKLLGCFILLGKINKVIVV